MSAPDAVEELVERFEFNLRDYKSGRYNEEQLRVEFVNPLFESLGWDVTNRRGYAEAYKDVIHEARVQVDENGTNGQAKAPDYSFRIGGTRKFFVEVKRPSINVKQDIHPAFQLRRYAWSADLPLSILTDFEELAVYDCRFRPEKGDEASVARVQYYDYNEYLDKWEEIERLFSKEAVLKGAFDKYAASEQKRGTEEVNEAFLNDIESWRESLAKEVAENHPDLEARQLNGAVQRIIDRIIFLRIAEDRGIEAYGDLEDVAEGANIYSALVDRFQASDLRYNAGLFYFNEDDDRAGYPDTVTPDLTVGDDVLRPILSGLYYPESPYVFDQIPADILGQVYEQFLGRVVVLEETNGERTAQVEEKPDVKKAGGVYYTPTYVVQHIVRRTLDPLLEDKEPEELEDVAVLDPACGSGSFLLVAYQHLLDWHRARYTESEEAIAFWSVDRTKAGKKAQRGTPYQPARIQRGQNGEWRLTVDEKRRILQEYIYGVDIDEQAVEVSKLSLFLKLLEGETQETLLRAGTRDAFERVLPDLGENIQCGNSLVGPDFYKGKPMDLFSREDQLQINAFDWESGFPSIMSRGGFDVVIGNPPYVRQEQRGMFKEYFQTKYNTHSGKADLFVYFIERGIDLLREGGRFGYIVSQSVLHADYASELRNHLWERASVEEFVDFGGLPVFKEAKDTYVCIPIFSKDQQSEETQITRAEQLEGLDLDAGVHTHTYEVPSSRFKEGTWSLRSVEEVELFKQIEEKTAALDDVVEGIYYGVKTGLNAAFKITEEERTEILEADPSAEERIYRYPSGQDVRRYRLRDRGRYVIAIPDGWTRAKMREAGIDLPEEIDEEAEQQAWAWLAGRYPGITEHLAPYAERARSRYDRGEFWWELRACSYYDVLEGEKIMYPDITKQPRFYLDKEGIYAANTVYILDSADPFLLGLLNSTLSWFMIGMICIPFGVRAGRFRYRLFTQSVKQIPVPKIDAGDEETIQQRENIVQLVERLQELQEERNDATGHEREVIDRQIRATDRQIDRRVYQLYDLSGDDIRVVEERGEFRD
jgi:type I restriction-modification system DNA methylase subunit